MRTLKRRLRRLTDRSWLVLAVMDENRLIAHPFRRRRTAADFMDVLAPQEQWSELSLIDLSWVPR